MNEIKSIDLSEPIDRKQAATLILQVNDSEPTLTTLTETYIRNPISHSSSVNHFLYPNSLLTLSSKVYDKFEPDEIATFTEYKQKMTDQMRQYITSNPNPKKYRAKKSLPSIPKETSDLDIDTINKDYYVKSDKANNVANFIKWILYNRENNTYQTQTGQKKLNIFPTSYEPTSIHVVTHSDVMKGFVENYLQSIGNRDETDDMGSDNTKDTSSTQSVINEMKRKASKPDQVQFKITRHAYSCNNALDEGKLGVLDKNFDPGLTYAGIILAKFRGQLTDMKGKLIYKSNTVFVSCLLRTWETATMLYLQHTEDEPLTLIISPFLKETHGTVSKALAARGNYPAFFFQQLQLFHYFLSYSLAIGLFDDIISKTDKTIQLFLNANYYVTITISQNKTLSWILNSNGIKYALNMPDVMPNGQYGGGWLKSYKRVHPVDDDTENRSKLPEEIAETNLWSIDFTVQISPIQTVEPIPNFQRSVPKPLTEQQRTAQENLDQLEADMLEGGSIFSRKVSPVLNADQNDRNTHRLNIIGTVLITPGTRKPGKMVLNTYACNPLCLKSYYSKRKLSTQFAQDRNKTCKKQMIDSKLKEGPNNKSRWFSSFRRNRGGRKTRKMRKVKK